MAETKLDKIIYIEVLDEENPIITENNFEEPNWKQKYKLMCSVNNLFGNEYWRAKAVQSEKTTVFKVRYSQIIENLDTEKSRIKFNDKPYDIKFIDNVKYENKWLKIKAILK